MTQYGILIFTGAPFGGMERRFARVFSFLEQEDKPVNLFCTADVGEALKELDIIDAPKNKIIILDKISSNWILLRKMNRILGLVKLFTLLSYKFKGTHIHLVDNPGLLSTLFSLSPFSFSFSVVDCNFEISKLALRIAARKAKFIDCLSQTIGVLTKEATKKIERCAPITISPCSFTDYSKVSLDNKRDIDVCFIARKTYKKGIDLLEETETKLENVNLFSDYTDRPFEILGRSKIFLSLQEADNYPSQSLLEAMASKCCVIATDVGETRSLVDTTCGVLIEKNSDQLAAKIKFLLERPNTMNRLGSAARKKVIEQHTLKRFSNYLWSCFTNNTK
jgi:hypothetical protein